ncbi:MAG: J domain-containing protein [Clostridiaceae bacterium]
MRNYYDVLEIKNSATPDEIKQAFRKCAKKYHPDKDLNDKTLPDKFKEINEAYSVLSDEESKKKYDEKISKSKGFNGKNSNTKQDVHNKNSHGNKGNPIENLNKQFEQFFGFNAGSSDVKENLYGKDTGNPINTSNIFNSFFNPKKK